MSVQSYFVTGTDTGVGKTELACGLLRAYAAAGRAVVGMKPIAAGARRVSGRLRNDDVERLRAASTVRVDRDAMNPYCFAPPIAPHLAARQSGRRIDVNVIACAYRALAARAEVVIVEGAGGLLVPLDERTDSADLVRRLRLPVILVVGVRLGCISHALLTAVALRARRLAFAGWFANRVDPAMREYRGNVETLCRRLSAPLLGEIPYRSEPRARAIAVDRALAASGIANARLR